MEREILEQPKILTNNAQRYFDDASKAVSGRSFQMVLLAARGSSDNAALFARYLIETILEIPVSLAAPSVLTRYGAHVKYPPCLAIGISQSGAAPDVSEVLSELRSAGHVTLALTNTAGSRVTHAAEHVIDLGVGPENSVAATKTYTASLLALFQTVRALGGQLQDPDGHLPTGDWSAVCRLAAERASGTVVRSDRWFCLARGYSFCTAQETALKLMECALVPCKPYSTADFLHGPRALATHGSVAVSYGPPPEGLSETGCEVVQAPECPDGPFAPLWDVFFGQWLALTVARARGLDPDRPAHLNKVTQTL